MIVPSVPLSASVSHSVPASVPAAPPQRAPERARLCHFPQHGPQYQRLSTPHVPLVVFPPHSEQLIAAAEASNSFWYAALALALEATGAGTTFEAGALPRPI